MEAPGGADGASSAGFAESMVRWENDVDGVERVKALSRDRGERTDVYLPDIVKTRNPKDAEKNITGRTKAT